MPLRKQICACPLDCFDVCSLVVWTDEEGKITKLEGNKDHPITKGFICDKGRQHIERMYSPKRLKYPMRKLDGRWKRISWEDAFGVITDKLKSYWDRYGTKSIALYNYSGSNGKLKNIENLFFDFLGDTTRFKGSLCCGAGFAAQSLDFGCPRYHSFEDLLNSKTIVIWGKNPAETSLHLFAAVKRAKALGSAVIVIDPLATETAGIADRHVRPLAGGDCALACAAAKYIIEKQLYDKAFIEKHTDGFEALYHYLKTLDAAALSQRCGVGWNEIVELAETLCNSKPASIHIGFGLQRCLFGGTAVRSIDMLAALSGNIGIPGGGSNYANAVHEHLVWHGLNFPERQNRVLPRAKMGKALKEATDPPVKMLFISRSNPLIQNPNSGEVLDAVNGVEFKICLEHFMTDTAEQCDMVLPITYFLEEEDIIASDSWNGYIHYNVPCAPRYHEARSEAEIYTKLADLLQLPGFPMRAPGSWIEALLHPSVENGMDIEALFRDGFVRNPQDQDIPWQEGHFATENGRMKLIDTASLETCLSEDRIKKEKYKLLTIHKKNSLHSQHFLNEASPLPLVYISPSDAAVESVQDGSKVKLSNAFGEMEALVCISSSCQREVLFMYEGWWKKNGGSVNRLTDDRMSDIGMQAVFNECTCRIERL